MENTKSLIQILRKLGLAAIVVWLAGTSSLPSASSEMGEGGTAYHIGPQNLLQIKILGQKALQQTFRVDDFGYITYPLVGRIRLAGYTVAEAEDIMQNVLKDDYIRNPHITIFIREHSRYSVLGEVRNPGNYEIIGKVSLVEAISIAGGFTPVADEKKIRVIRKNEGGEQSLIINVQDIMDGKQKNDAAVEAGDIINVPKSFF